MRQVIRDIVRYCDEHGLNAAEMMRDYFAEKEAHITRAEAERLVARARAELENQVTP